MKKIKQGRESMHEASFVRKKYIIIILLKIKEEDKVS